MKSLRSKLQSFLNLRGTDSGDRCFYPEGWSREELGHFNRDSKAYLFRSIMTFFNTNAIDGDYFEFGCYGGYTMRMAWDYSKLLRPEMTYFAFDSFEGFPDLQGIDVGHWKRGDLAMSEARFREICENHGMPGSKLTTTKGFFSDSLKAKDTAKAVSGRKAAIVYVDVDTYSPASEVLAFMAGFLQRGTIIVFDDWNCFYADDSLGERRAWREFTESHPNLSFTPFVSTHLAQSFICLKSEATVSQRS